MKTVGLRELRQNASELVRAAEAGTEVTITVSGRASVRLVPAATNSWRRWQEVTEIFAGPEDAQWATDRDLVDQEIRDPWEQR